MSNSSSSIRALLSPAIEDYLKPFYKLQQSGNASTKAIADAMGYSAASVTNMLKKLGDLGLADYKSHRGVTLSPAGEKVALEVIRHHRLLELYLSEIMGYTWDQVHAEAEKLEHHISEQFEDKINEMLGFPKFDPHGDPIPAKDGTIPSHFGDLLTEVELQQWYIIKRIEEQAPDFLRYIAGLGLIPGTKIYLESRAPFNGPVALILNESPLIIGKEAAQCIHVEIVE